MLYFTVIVVRVLAEFSSSLHSNTTVTAQKVLGLVVHHSPIEEL